GRVPAGAPLEDRVAAVDHERVARVVAAGVACKVHRDTAEVVAHPPPTHRHAGQHLAREGLAVERGFRHRRVDPARHDRVAAAVVIWAKPPDAPPRPLTPALAKKASTRPRALTVSPKQRSTAASSLTSQRMARALPPWPWICLRAAAFLSSLVPQMQTVAPACAIASAMPSPMPLLPPVTSATLPLRSNPLYAMDVLSL